MQSSSPCTKIREKSQIALTIGGSLCSPSLEKSLFVCSKTDWYPTSLMTIYQKRSVGSESTRAYRHGVHSHTAPREIQGAEQRTVCSVCGPEQSFLHSEHKVTVVDHGALWLNPPKFLSMVIQLHKDQPDQVRLNGDLSGFFLIVNSVKQDCVLAPTLFSIFLSIMLKQVIEDLLMTVQYTSAIVLMVVCLTSGDCMHTKTLDILFVDDAALVSHTERALQHLTSCFVEAAQLFVFKVSLKKIEVPH